MINKLVEKIKKTGATIVVGLDPMLSYMYRTGRLRSTARHWKARRKQSGSSIRRSWTRHTT